MVSLSCTFLRIISYSSNLEADSDLVCQPGVGWMEINETLQQKGKTAT